MKEKKMLYKLAKNGCRFYSRKGYNLMGWDGWGKMRFEIAHLSHAHELLLLLVLLGTVQGLMRETLSLSLSLNTLPLTLPLPLWCGVLVELLLVKDMSHAA